MRICIWAFLVFFFSVVFIGPVLADQHDPPRIQPAEVVKILESGEKIIFFDVRTVEAARASLVTIPDSIRVTSDSDLQSIMKGIPKDSLIVPFCT